jgi:PIN domain nuclease of toxin-antitoxin system
VTEATTAVVADTHIVVWYVLNPAKLSGQATTALEGCVAAGEPICVSAHSLIELVYAVERPTNPFTEDDHQAVLETFDAEDSPFDVVPVTAEIANRVASVPRMANADPGDRGIVATAEVLGLSIVSADSKLPAMTSLAVIT